MIFQNIISFVNKRIILIIIIIIIFIIYNKLHFFSKNYYKKAHYHSLNKNNAESVIVFTKSNIINVRNGPDLNYNILFQLNKSKIPIKLLHKIDNWCFIEMIDKSNKGWVLCQSLLRKKNTTLIEKEQILYRIPNNKKQIIKTLDKNTIVTLLKCNLNWCRVKIDNKITGWIKASK